MRLIDADVLEKQFQVLLSHIYEKGDDDAALLTVIQMVKSAPTMGGWTSVKDKLPEIHCYEEDGDTWLISEPVLVATNKGVTIGYYEDDLDPKFKPCWNDREHGEGIPVTHWMELPAAPEVSSSGARIMACNRFSRQHMQVIRLSDA